MSLALDPFSSGVLSNRALAAPFGSFLGCNVRQHALAPMQMFGSCSKLESLKHSACIWIRHTRTVLVEGGSALGQYHVWINEVILQLTLSVANYFLKHLQRGQKQLSLGCCSRGGRHLCFVYCNILT